MASPTLPALLLAFLFLVAAAAAPGAGAFDGHVYGDGSFLLLDCGDGSGTASAKNSSANVADLLAALPSAAAPEGTAVLSRGGAFVRGVCIGNDSSPGDCRACIATAAGNITGGCGGPTGRRGGTWSDGCFMAYYADAAAARDDGDDNRRKVLCDGDIPRSYLDDDDRGSQFVYTYYHSHTTHPDPTLFWLLVDLAQRAADEPARTLAAGEQRSDYNPGMTVRALAQCTGDDRADCLRCLKGSAYQAVLSCGGAGAGWLRGGRVLSYGCYMRFEVSYRCGNPVQPADCSSAPAPASGGAGALLRWLAGGLVPRCCCMGPAACDAVQERSAFRCQIRALHGNSSNKIRWSGYEFLTDAWCYHQLNEYCYK